MEAGVLTVTSVLLLLGFVFTAIAAAGKMPPWPAVLVLYVIELLHLLPR